MCATFAQRYLTCLPTMRHTYTPAPRQERSILVVQPLPRLQRLAAGRIPHIQTRPFSLTKQRQKGLCAVDHAPKIDVEHPAPVIDGRRADRLAASRQDILIGLTAAQKRLSPKYLYDERGSQLFDEICSLPEYYPTRTELELLRANAAELAALVGPRAEIVELGAGSSRPGACPGRAAGAAVGGRSPRSHRSTPG